MICIKYYLLDGITIETGFSRRAGDRRFSPCTKVYHAGYKFWIHFIFGTTLNVSTKETKRFLLSAYKVLCKCRICSYKCCRFSKFPGGACSRTLLDDPPLTSILSPPTMPHLGEPCRNCPEKRIYRDWCLKLGDLHKKL